MTNSKATEENEMGTRPDLDSLISQLTLEGRNKAIEMAVERGFVDSNYVHLAVLDKEKELEELQEGEVTAKYIPWLRASISIAQEQGDTVKTQSLAQKILSYCRAKEDFNYAAYFLEDQFGEEEAKKALPELINEIETRAESRSALFDSLMAEAKRKTGYSQIRTSLRSEFELYKMAAELCEKAGDDARAVRNYVKARDLEKAFAVASREEKTKGEERTRSMQAKAEYLGATPEGFFYRTENKCDLSLDDNELELWYQRTKESVQEAERGKNYNNPNWRNIELAEFAIKAGKKGDARRILEDAISDELQKKEIRECGSNVKVGNMINPYFFLEAAQRLVSLGLIPRAQEVYEKGFEILVRNEVGDDDTRAVFAAKHGDISRASEYWKCYAKKQGDNYDRRKVLEGAKLAEDFGYLEEALSLYEQEAVADPWSDTNPNQYTLKHAIRIARKLGDEERARELCAKVGDLRLEVDGEIWEEAEHPTRAKDCYQKAGDDYESHGDLASAYKWFTKAGNNQKTQEMQEKIKAEKRKDAQARIEHDKARALPEKQENSSTTQEESPTIDQLLTVEKEGRFKIAERYAEKRQHPLQKVYGLLHDFFESIDKPLDPDYRNRILGWGPASIRSGDEEYVLF